MNAQDAAIQRARLKEFDELNSLRGLGVAALEKLQRDDPNGPCGQGPFTGNTRESRRIISLDIQFSPTRGGAQGLSMKVDHLWIEAYEFGEILREK